MFTQLEERLIWAAVVSILVIGGGWYIVEKLESRGAEKCIAADAKVTAPVIAHNAIVQAQDIAIVSQEKKTYEQAVAAPVLNPIHVSVCHEAASRPVREAPTAGPGIPESPDVRAGDRPDPVPGPDIGPSLQELGKRADAQVTGLLDYIHNVCQKR